MHIAEGIITGVAAFAYAGAGAALMAVGARGIRRFQEEHPERKPLIGMGAAVIFFLTLIPIPAFTGTTSHPCATPLIAILLGPRVALALTGVSLLLQAALFAHGGFSSWGANLLALGLVGGMSGWGAFQFARKLGAPIGWAGALGGVVGDILVYVAAGLILALALSHAPGAQYSFAGYLSVIYVAYGPTQLPLALGEAAITGLVLRHVLRQRPEVLSDLRVWGGRDVQST
ncbi:MAG: energy-coupling factor ABC transporter permease [Pseudomonadales bacterium]|jgi:cobalt/nickel transport system permease protein|nr:energy-coupling factor ABC transporter permease [Pseudomonadales bacterium]